LELSADPRAFEDLTIAERYVIERRFGQGDSMKVIACDLGCTHAEAADLLGRAVDRLRDRLAPDR
jgi:DNA-directed RNA polymerase specialized sigma24 family protein